MRQAFPAVHNVQDRRGTRRLQIPEWLRSWKRRREGDSQCIIYYGVVWFSSVCIAWYESNTVTLVDEGVVDLRDCCEEVRGRQSRQGSCGIKSTSLRLGIM